MSESSDSYELCDGPFRMVTHNFTPQWAFTYSTEKDSNGSKLNLQTSIVEQGHMPLKPWGSHQQFQAFKGRTFLLHVV